jgi:putative ABC transport system ATP-binding protein
MNIISRAKNLIMSEPQIIGKPHTMIETVALGKTVASSEGDLQILAGINLCINSGESLAIVGASGSGKSTLLSLLAGLDTPSTGSVSLNGQDLTAMNEDGRAEMRNQYVGFVFQSFQLLSGLTALENVMLPLGLAHRLTHTPKQLSGGEQQRVALARAFVTKPTVLFADEPTGNLDSKTGEHIIELLFELNQEQKTTLILVTHDKQLASRCQRTITLEAGLMV